MLSPAIIVMEYSFCLFNDTLNVYVIEAVILKKYDIAFY